MDGKTVSARFTESTVWELDFLKSMLHNKTTTEVLTEAVHHLYILQSRKQQKKTAFDFLKDSGFIGGTAGRKNDSVDYKKQAAKRIKKKT